MDTPVTTAELQRLAVEQVAPPGDFTAYANYGTALLAVLVEDITDLPIRTYFQRNIWQPLGMTHTDFAMGLSHPPGAVRAQNLRGGKMQERTYLAFHPLYWPIGAIYSSSLDMGRYVRAHTHDRASDSSAPLGPTVFQRAAKVPGGTMCLSSGSGGR